jgi:hypothetical protein
MGTGFDSFWALLLVLTRRPEQGEKADAEDTKYEDGDPNFRKLEKYLESWNQEPNLDCKGFSRRFANKLMNQRAIAAIAGTIVIGGALGVAVAQNSSVVESASTEALEASALQEMTASQMLSYLKEQGTPYIVETTNIPKNRKFEVNFNGVKGEALVKSVAKALDMQATLTDGVYVLKPNTGRFFTPDNFEHDFDFDFDHMHAPHSFDWDEKMTPEQKAKFEAEMKEFGKHMKELGEKIKVKVLDSDEMKKMREEIALTMPKIKDLKSLEDLEKELAKELKDIKDIEPKTFVRLRNTSKLIDSVTESQWKLIEKQGYLLISDLTPAQRELIGLDDKNPSDFSLSISKDGKKLVIKSKE